MKPSPRYHFPLTITSVEREEGSQTYGGIYELRLNYEVRLAFVPDVRRGPGPWPPPCDDPGPEPSICGARISRIETSPYAITPDPTRAGHEELVMIEVPDRSGAPQPRPTAIFYVTTAAFATYLQEFEALWGAIYVKDLGEPQRGPDDILYVPEAYMRGMPYPVLAQWAVVQLLLQRIIPSPYLTDYDLKLLGRQRVGGVVQPLPQFAHLGEVPA